MRTITIANEKGGVGKSTTAVSLAAALYLKGYKTLLIDTDPQRNSSDTFGAKVDGIATLVDVLYDNYPIEQAIQHLTECDVVAGDPGLKKAPQTLTGTFDYQKLARALDSIEGDYQFCVIDTQPTSNILTRNALFATDDVIVPLDASRYSIQGLKDFQASVEEIRQGNPKLKIAGLLLTSARRNTTINSEALEVLPELATKLGTKAFKSTIREAVAIQDAQKNQMSIFKFAPRSAVAQDYISFINEYLEG